VRARCTASAVPQEPAPSTATGVRGSVGSVVPDPLKDPAPVP